jgi:hypothetical protein
MNASARQSDPPLLRGLQAIQHASQHPEVPLMRLTLFATKPANIGLDTAYWLAQRGREDEVYAYALPDA